MGQSAFEEILLVSPPRAREVRGFGMPAEIKFSLGTKDWDEALLLCNEHNLRLEREWRATLVDRPPDELSHRQIVALAGEFYSETVATHAEEAGAPPQWRRSLEEIERTKRFWNGTLGGNLLLPYPWLEIECSRCKAKREVDMAALRHRTSAALACEPRHASWFTPEVDAWLRERRICRVAADPPRVPDAELPGGWTGLSYFRLHGAPRIYYSAYDGAFLRTLKTRLDFSSSSGETWCILDNTAAGAALENALDLLALTGLSR